MSELSVAIGAKPNDTWLGKFLEEKSKGERLQERIVFLESSLKEARSQEARARERLKTLEGERDLIAQRHSREKEKVLEQVRAAQAVAAEETKERENLVAEVNRDAKTVVAMAVHADLEKPRPSECACVACRLRVVIEERDARSANSVRRIVS